MLVMMVEQDLEGEAEEEVEAGEEVGEADLADCLK